MKLPLDDPTSLSLLFHLNSEPWLNDAAYENAGRQETLDAPGAPALPSPPDSELAALLRSRRSSRSFAPRTMPLPVLSALLAAAQGIVERVDVAEGQVLVRRAAPSAGGLYPLETYLFTRRVEGLADGVHRYAPLGHRLVTMRSGDVSAELAGALYAWPFVAEANIVLALAARFDRTQKKYGPRGYRYMLLEAGHAMQNACLRAAELDLATLCIGGFVDSRINALLELKPTHAGVLYMAGLGYPAG